MNVRYLSISLGLLILIGSSLLTYVSGGDTPYPELETSTIGGKVVDIKDTTPCENFTVRLEALDLVPMTTLTDENGWYRFNITGGNYTIHVHDCDGMEVGRKTVNIGDGISR